MEAVRKGRIEAAKVLLKRGVDVNRRNKYGFTALILASFIGPTILAIPGRSTELSIQASDGQVVMVRQLLDAGGDPSASTDEGFTPLMAASGEGYVEIVKLLLQSGADVTAKNKRGSTPLSLACQENHREVIDILNSYLSFCSGSIGCCRD
jgi:ankyrin repeat protein